jgi:hypothetical protein
LTSLSKNAWLYWWIWNVRVAGIAVSTDKLNWLPSLSLPLWKIWISLLRVVSTAEPSWNWPKAIGLTIISTCWSSARPAPANLSSVVLWVYLPAEPIIPFVTSACPRLLFQLAQSHLDGSYPTLLENLMKINLLILDDWMRDPISASEARDLLEVIDDRFGRASTLVASQLPVPEWFVRFPDPTHADAILDRIIHNAYRLNLTGDSQRKLRAAIPMPST